VRETFTRARAPGVGRFAGAAMSKIQHMRELLLDLMQEHERDGALPTSVRFLFYELVQRGQIPKKAKGRTDRLVSEALMDLRESGQVAWEDIVDETRDLEDYTGHCDLKATATFYIERAVELDPRRGQRAADHHREPDRCGARTWLHQVVSDQDLTHRYSAVDAA
jgi:hypothetical protein